MAHIIGISVKPLANYTSECEIIRLGEKRQRIQMSVEKKPSQRYSMTGSMYTVALPHHIALWEQLMSIP